MLFLPGQPCPSCKQIVYGIDDTITMLPRPGTERLARFQPGLYHYDCFLAAPFKDAYLSLCEAETKRFLEGKAALWQIVAQDADFALVLKPLAKSSTLIFLELCREISFLCEDQLQEFCGLVSTPDGGLKAIEPGARFMIFPQPQGWTIAEKVTVPVGLEFSSADFAKIEEGLGLPDLLVDVGKVCKQFGVAPRSTSCPLERANGLVRSVKRSESEEKVRLRIAVDHWKKVPLSLEGFDEMKVFLKHALTKAPS
jgi:hypothetical protein